MEYFGYKNIYQLSQIVTTQNSRGKRPKSLIPENVKNSDFFSILYSKPLRELRKTKFKIGDKVWVSECDLHFRKRYKPQFTPKVFKNNVVSSRKPPIYTRKDEQDEIVRGNVN